MDFLNFYFLASGVVSATDISKSETLKRIQKEVGRGASWTVVQALALRYCYLQLFPFSPAKPITGCVNDALLDFDPVSDYTSQELVVVESRGSTFCFRLEELLSIFHNDLSRSVLEYEPQYHILTLTKSFRLPTHPYLQKRFTSDEIAQIVHQMVLKFDTLPKKFPEVFLFLRNATALLKKCDKKSNYEVTTLLESFFESHQCHYVEKYTVKTRENQSYWGISLPKRVRTERQMYLWFLEVLLT